MSADAATKENKALAWLRSTPVNTALNFSLPLKTWNFIPAELLLLLLLLFIIIYYAFIRSIQGYKPIGYRTCHE